MTGIITINCPSADEFPYLKGAYLFYLGTRSEISPLSVKHPSKRGNW